MNLFQLRAFDAVAREGSFTRAADELHVTQAAVSQQVKQLDIVISAEGVFSVNNQVLEKNDLNSLMEALQKESGGDTKMPLSISADGKTQHQAVITAMDAAGKLGFSHLRMSTVEAVSQP